LWLMCFFFQAEDGIRDRNVTGVQTCALPIYPAAVLHALSEKGITRLMVEGGARVASSFVAAGLVDEIWLLRGPDRVGADGVAARSEEHTSELQSRFDLVCRLLLEKKKYDTVN